MARYRGRNGTEAGIIFSNPIRGAIKAHALVAVRQSVFISRPNFSSSLAEIKLACTRVNRAITNRFGYPAPAPIRKSFLLPRFNPPIGYLPSLLPPTSNSVDGHFRNDVYIYIYIYIYKFELLTDLGDALFERWEFRWPK